MSMSAWVSFECQWLACTGNHFAVTMNLVIYCDSFSAMGPPCG